MPTRVSSPGDCQAIGMTYLVHRQRSVVSNNRRQAAQKRPRVRAPFNRSFLVPHLSSIRAHKSPDQNRDPRNRHNDALRHEQPAQIVRMHAQERHTQQPKQKEANHRVRLDTLVFTYRVLQRQD